MEQIDSLTIAGVLYGCLLLLGLIPLIYIALVNRRMDKKIEESDRKWRESRKINGMETRET